MREPKKDKTVALILKLTFFYFLRLILVCALSFMAIPLGSFSQKIFWPILAIFYFLIILYFFSFTSHREGLSDRNRIETGIIKNIPFKGYISSGILTFILIIIGVIPFLYGYSSSSLICKIFLILYYLLSMSTAFAAQVFVGVDVSDINTEMNMQNLIIRFVVFCAILLICTIVSGISYKFGLDNKHPLRPLTDTVYGWFKQ